MNTHNHFIYKKTIEEIHTIGGFLKEYDSLYSKYGNKTAWKEIVKFYITEGVREITYLESGRSEGIPCYAVKDGIETDVFSSIGEIARHLKIKPNLVQRALKTGWKTGGYNFFYF